MDNSQVDLNSDIMPYSRDTEAEDERDIVNIVSNENCAIRARGGEDRAITIYV